MLPMQARFLRLVQLELAIWEVIVKEEQHVSTDLLQNMGECPWYIHLLRLLIAAVPGFGDSGDFTNVLNC